MNRKLLAVGAMALMLLDSSASASTTYWLPWTGTLTESWSSSCVQPPGLVAPCTVVTPRSGNLSVSVDSNLDGDYSGPDASVSIGDLGYGNWGISGPDGSWIEVAIQDGSVDMLEAGGPSPNGRGWFSVIVADGAGYIDFDTASTDPDLFLAGVIAVPEPETWLMLATCIALFLATRARWWAKLPAFVVQEPGIGLRTALRKS